MIKIYCITDINNLKYVGKTKSTLNHRLSQHKHNKKTRGSYTSKLLDLDNCEIKELCTCQKEESRNREYYWIDKIDCVNRLNGKFDINKWKKEWYKRNNEAILIHRGLIREYKNSWGGDKRFYNNLLQIDCNLFF